MVALRSSDFMPTNLGETIIFEQSRPQFLPTRNRCLQMGLGIISLQMYKSGFPQGLILVLLAAHGG
jgi:hypothetical protein